MTKSDIAATVAAFIIGVTGVLIYQKYEHYKLFQVMQAEGCVDLGPPDGKSPIVKYLERGFFCDGTVVVVAK